MQRDIKIKILFLNTKLPRKTRRTLLKFPKFLYNFRRKLDHRRSISRETMSRSVLPGKIILRPARPATVNETAIFIGSRWNYIPGSFERIFLRAFPGFPFLDDHIHPSNLPSRHFSFLSPRFTIYFTG